MPELSNLPNVQIFDVELIFLLNDANDDQESKRQILYSFIRKRSQGGMHAYGITNVIKLENGEKAELKQVISAREYTALSKLKDPQRYVLRQKRYCFLWEKQSFHIYEYLSPESLVGKLFLFCQSEGEPILPPFLSVGKEIHKETGESASSRVLSLIPSHSS